MSFIPVQSAQGEDCVSDDGMGNGIRGFVWPLEDKEERRREEVGRCLTCPYDAHMHGACLGPKSAVGWTWLARNLGTHVGKRAEA